MGEVSFKYAVTMLFCRVSDSEDDACTAKVPMLAELFRVTPLILTVNVVLDVTAVAMGMPFAH